MFKKFCLYLFCLYGLFGFSQTRKRHYKQYELGFFGGGSYYIGDINPRKHFFPSHPGFGAFLRYSNSYRFAFRVGANYGTVSADDLKSKEPDQLERGLNFRSRIYDAYAVSEFNFVDYRIGNDKHYFTMFIFAGLGGCLMNPQTNRTGTYIDLKDQKTEGNSYSRYQITVPFGVGFKWNVTDNMGLGIEWGPRKMFTDYLDDVSTSYPGIISSVLSGPGIPGSMRGNPRSKDWYFFYGFTLNIKLPKINKECYKTF